MKQLSIRTFLNGVLIAAAFSTPSFSMNDDDIALQTARSTSSRVPLVGLVQRSHPTPEITHVPRPEFQTTNYSNLTRPAPTQTDNDAAPLNATLTPPLPPVRIDDDIVAPNPDAIADNHIPGNNALPKRLNLKAVIAASAIICTASGVVVWHNGRILASQSLSTLSDDLAPDNPSLSYHSITEYSTTYPPAKWADDPTCPTTHDQKVYYPAAIDVEELVYEPTLQDTPVAGDVLLPPFFMPSPEQKMMRELAQQATSYEAENEKALAHSHLYCFNWENIMTTDTDETALLATSPFTFKEGSMALISYRHPYCPAEMSTDDTVAGGTSIPFSKFSAEQKLMRELARQIVAYKLDNEKALALRYPDYPAWKRTDNTIKTISLSAIPIFHPEVTPKVEAIKLSAMNPVRSVVRGCMPLIRIGFAGAFGLFLYEKSRLNRSQTAAEKKWIEEDNTLRTQLAERTGWNVDQPRQQAAEKYTRIRFLNEQNNMRIFNTVVFYCLTELFNYY